ncbi:MAG: hypothetical protein ACM3VT_20160, partial [Solirubrobacterales bacterium]
MKHLQSIAASFVLACTLALSAQAATTVYVSPNGNDAWSGLAAAPNAQKTDGPVATLQRARDIIRQKRSQDDQPRVVVADGRYSLTEPFALAPQDSGVTFEAVPGAKPVFSAG